MQMYQVGQRVEQFRGRDGLFLTIDGSGVFLLCRMAKPTAKERRAFRSRQPVRISMGEEIGVLYWTVTFGDIPTMDCTFGPQIVPGGVEMETPGEGQGYAMTVILADAETGEVISIRLIGLPHDFSLALKDTVDRLKTRSADAYRFGVASVYGMSTQELADRAACTAIVWEG